MISVLRQPRLRRVLDHPEIFITVRRLVNGSWQPTFAAIREHLHLTDRVSVLDVCCGTGTYAAAVPGPYLGLDLNERFVRFARRRYSNLPRKQFVVGDATAMPLPRQSFDTAIFIDALHHFPVEINRAIFHQLAAIVRAEILIVDVSPHVRNPAKRLALAIDRGDFIRPVAQQVAIVESELRIVRRSVFDQGLYTQTVYVCRAP